MTAFMKHFAACVGLHCILMFYGCGSSSDESLRQSSMTQSGIAPDTLQQRMRRLTDENNALRQQLQALQEQQRSAIAQIAAFEIQPVEPKAAGVERNVIPDVSTSQRSTGSYSNQYERALSLYMAREYENAGELFQTLLERRAPTDIEDNCYYWIGECHVARKEYEKGIDQFRKVLTYGNSDKADDAQIMIAKTYTAMGNTKAAKTEYQKLIREFPNSPYVKSAKAKLKSL